MTPRGQVSRTLSALLLLLAGAAAAWGLCGALSDLYEANIGKNPVAAVALAVGSSSVPLLLLAGRRWWRAAPPAALPCRALLRWSFVAAVFLWFGYVVLAGVYFRARVGCVVAAWAAVVGLLAWRLPPQGKPRRIAALLFGSALALFAGELALRTAAALLPSPLLTRRTAAVTQTLNAYRFPPHHPHLGFPSNALGFYDEDFAPPGPTRRPSVAVIGDSFSASFVPHEFHYTTVAERELGDAEVWNVGWDSIGPIEYRLLLREYILPLVPDVVAVSLFLGNDYGDVLRWRTADRMLADWFDRGNVLLCEVPRRLLLLRDVAGEKRVSMRQPDLAAAAVWLHDPMREPGTFTAEAFMRVEVERARTLADESGWDAFTAALRALREAAGARPFGFVLIPDEFMVEDGLWALVQQAAGRPLERHRLRERLVAWCGQLGVPCLDLWPVLRAVAPLADGDRHLYLKRDSHWNVRGNATAGAALTPFLRSLLQQRH